jgi:hypothetical protein
MMADEPNSDALDEMVDAAAQALITRLRSEKEQLQREIADLRFDLNYATQQKALTQTAPNGDTLTDMPQITRVELIDYSRGGSVYSNWQAHEVAVSVQDQGRTLKVFIK